MVRKQIYLEPDQNKKIKVISAKYGKTEAEIIREAIEDYLAAKKTAVDDPLAELIGIVETAQKDGSTMHDRDLYGETDGERNEQK